MHPFFKPLEKICQKHLTDKKILIMPSYLDGNTLKKSLSREGFSMVNLHITTLFDLARDYCEEIILRNKYRLLDYSSSQVFIFKLLKKITRENTLAYFKSNSITPGICHSIYFSIKELKMAGYSALNFPQHAIIHPKKKADLCKILQVYQQKMKEEKLIDEADLFLQSISLKKKHNLNQCLFIIPSDLKYNYLEKSFFQKVVSPHSEVIRLPELFEEKESESLSLFKTTRQEQLHSKKMHLTDYLYRADGIPESLPEKIRIGFTRAHGEYNEVKGIVRRLKAGKIPFDKVSVLYTVQEPYSQYMYQLARQYDFEVTFASGISIMNTSPAKVLFHLLDWIKDDYSIGRFHALMTGGNIQFKKDLEIPDLLEPQKVAALLRQASIGRSRKRYMHCLDRKIENTKMMIEQVSEKRKEILYGELKELHGIKLLLKKIFQALPVKNFDHTISPELLVRGLLHVLNDYCKLDKEQSLEVESLNRISDKLSVFSENHCSLSDMPVNEILSLIKDLVKNERIGCSEPRSHCLHLASYKKGIWLHRPYTFIVGMDASKFPDSVRNSSVLLDTERKLTGRISTDTGKGKESQYQMLQLLSSLEGEAIFSFSCIDTQNNRELAPASLLLHLYRLESKDEKKDYSDLYHNIKEISGFIPGDSQEILDATDWFLYNSYHHSNRLMLLCKSQYPEMTRGIKATNLRFKNEFNRFNGKVEVNSVRIDPRINRGLIMSSSRLEAIAACPYLYFLKYVLRISPPDEMTEESDLWLNPSEKGSLLHLIFEIFYRKLKNLSPDGKFTPPSFTIHWPMLRDIVRDQLEQKKVFSIPPSNLIYQHECKEILTTCQFFLHCEEKNYHGEIPTYFELAFGTRDNRNETLRRKIKAVELNLPGGQSVSFQGKIDRIDWLKKDTYRIIDYKTGDPHDISKTKPFQYGTQIQHALYAIALKSIFKKAGISESTVISESGYYFPTLKGQGRRVLYGEKNRELALLITDTLLDIVSKGYFAMTQKPDYYLCVDYKDIMEQNPLITINKKNSGNFKEGNVYESLGRLLEYD